MPLDDYDNLTGPKDITSFTWSNGITITPLIETNHDDYHKQVVVIPETPIDPDTPTDPETPIDPDTPISGIIIKTRRSFN